VKLTHYRPPAALDRATVLSYMRSCA